MTGALLGGIGLFLLGMLLLTDGLKAAAGDALKRILTRFTARPALAFVSGATVTAMVQSSSATTVATIGFVSAGLLSFSQAIGVVIGGSVGTTTTGWLVSLLGLKLSVGKLALPLIGLGALMRLTLRGQVASLGLALAGFGLIFVGIDTLQAGMAGLAERVRPDSFPDATVSGRFLLVLIGVGLTVLMQSSSAAMATTITAFHSGTLNLEQALSLVIGASIGTTVTAAIAAIGASVPARRTALAHILFNGFAGAIAFVIEPWFAWGVERYAAREHLMTGAVLLAVFHTGFNVLAAALVLPWVHRLAGLVTRMVKESGPPLTRYLDRSLRQVPEVAVEAVRRTLVDCAVELLRNIERRLSRDPVQALRPLAPVRAAIEEVRSFLGGIPPVQHAAAGGDTRLSVVHALDHLEQLAVELARVPRAGALVGYPQVETARQVLHELVSAALEAFHGDGRVASIENLGTVSGRLATLRRQSREVILRDTAYGGLSPEQANHRLDTLRWLDSAGYHAWRSAYHLQNGGGSAGTPGAEGERAAAPAGSGSVRGDGSAVSEGPGAGDGR